MIKAKPLKISTKNPRRLAGFAVVVVVVVVIFFDEIRDDVHDVFSECVFSPEKINNPFSGDVVFTRKVRIFYWT